MSDIQQAIQDITDLPTLPDVVARINRLVRDANASAGDLNDILSRDIALSAKVLRLVNSSFYGFPRRITSIAHAVVILGFNAIRNLAFSAFVFSAFKNRAKSFDYRGFWSHSLGVAVASNALAQHINFAQAEDAFMGGLLHDVGKVALSHSRAEMMENALVETAKADGLFLEIEKNCLPWSHTEFGGALLDRWNLPLPIVDVALNHHNIAAARNRKLCAIVHIADIVARAMLIGNPCDNRIPAIDPAAWSELGLAWSDVGMVMDRMLAEFENADVFAELLPARESIG